MGSFFFSAKFFVYLSTLSPAHIFAVRGRLQRWEGNIRGTLKIPISNSLVNLKKFRSTAQACFQKIQFSIFIINWEKVQLEQHLKFPKPLCELEATWKYILRPTLKNPNFASMDELEKIIS